MAKKSVADSSQLPRNWINHQSFSRPSLDEIKKDEAYKKYDLLNPARLRITKKMEELKADIDEINRKLELVSLICSNNGSIRWHQGFTDNQRNSVPGKTGVIYLTTGDRYYRKPIILTPDQKRCQKRLINKGRMDTEYLQKVEEELLSSKQIDGMTSCGTQELNDLMKSMAQRIQHGIKNRKEEMKIQDKLRDLKITREMYTGPDLSYPSWHHTEYWLSASNNEYRYKESIKQLIKNLLYAFEIWKNDQMAYKAKVMRLRTKSEHVWEHIMSLEKELDENVNSEREITYNLTQTLRRLQETCYDEYQSLLTEVAKTADVANLVKQLCYTEVERFITQGNDNQAFRDDRRKLIDA